MMGPKKKKNTTTKMGIVFLGELVEGFWVVMSL